MIARCFVVFVSCLFFQTPQAGAVEVKAVGNNRIVFGGTSKPGPFRITPRSLILVEVGGSPGMLAKGQVVDLAGTVFGRTFNASKILVHSRPKLTARRRRISSAGAAFVKGQNKPLPATVTGRVVSTNPLRVQSLGLVTNTYQLQLRPGAKVSVPQQTAFARVVFAVEGKRVKVLLTQTPGLLKPGISLKRHDTQGTVLKSIYAYSSESITQEQFDRLMGIRRQSAKKKSGKKATAKQKTGSKKPASKKND